MNGYRKKVALGLGLRHDWGSQYASHQFQGELRWLGIRSTPGPSRTHQQGGVITPPSCPENRGRFTARSPNSWLAQLTSQPHLRSPSPLGLLLRPSTRPAEAALDVLRRRLSQYRSHLKRSVWAVLSARGDHTIALVRSNAQAPGTTDSRPSGSPSLQRYE